MNFLKFVHRLLGDYKFAVFIALIVLFIAGELAVATVWGGWAAIGHATAVIACNAVLED